MSLLDARIAAAALGTAGALWLASPLPMEAQTTSASVFGSVRDAQGASLAGAMVTLTSNTQGNTQEAATDRAGSFVFTYVRPDIYTLKVSLAGFKTLENARAVVSANDKFSAGILTMQVGDREESVTVVARAKALQSTSGERSYGLESAAIGNIAVSGRSFFGLVGLVPGVLPNAGGPPRDTPPTTSAGSFTANGQRPNSNNVTIDGITSIDTGDNGGNMATTNLDAVAELKVLTSSYQAEFGRAVGAQVQVVTKSGTRDFTGSAYWYGRRSDWDANTWTNNRTGTAKAETSRNDFGYTLGGPVYIPGKFNEDRKKLFFFFSQEFQRRQDPTAERRVTVPTLLERKGDFSESLDADGTPFPYIRDTATNLPCNKADTRGCFRDGGVLGRIPQDQLYPSTLGMLAMFPLPNVEGQAGYNFSSQAPANQPRREELLRLDFHPSDRWRFTGRFMESKDEQELPYGRGIVRSNVPVVQGHFDAPGYNWMVSANGALGRRTALEVSVGSAHNSIDIYTTNEGLTKAGAGLSDLPLLYPDAVQGDLPPSLVFGGGRVGNPVVLITSQGPFTNFNTTYDAIANLTKVLASHVVKAGLFFQRSKKDQSTFADFNGLASFNNNANNPLDSGNPFANAALGVYDTFQQASAYAKPKWRYTNLEWYIQDNWKVDRRLTLDYGVRFYYLTPQWDVSRQASNFLPERYDPDRAVRLFQPAMVGGRRVAYDPETGQTLPADLIGRVVPKSGDRFNGTFQAGQGIEETLTTGSGFRVSPRIGFAYDVSGSESVVVRGSFGIFYDRPQGNLVFNLISNPPGISVEQLAWGRFADLGTSVPLNAPIGLTPTQHEWEIPMVYAWNVGAQAKLPGALTLDVAYVGSESRRLPQTIPINAVPYGAAFLPQNQDKTRPPSPTPGATALPVDFLRPYPGYGDVSMIEYTAFSNYHALQASLNRQFDRGLLLGITYTWSKALGLVTDDFSTGRPDGDEANRRANYSYLGFDRPHNFVVSCVYQTPRVAKGVVGVLANGWQISGLYRWTSGTPYPITFNIPGIGAQNLTGSDPGQNARIVVTGDPGKGWSSDPYRQIDTSVFAPPQTGSLGFESARFFLHGPPINNLDLSISKSIPLGGRRKIEIRLDAFNALNHPQFTGVNSQVNFASLTDPRITNLPFDQAGRLVNTNGFGTVTGVRSPRQLQIVVRLAF